MSEQDTIPLSEAEVEEVAWTMFAEGASLPDWPYVSWEVAPDGTRAIYVRAARRVLSSPTIKGLREKAAAADTLGAALAKAQVELVHLREALKPFATLGKALPPGRAAPVALVISAFDLHQAEAALAGSPSSPSAQGETE